MNQTLILNHLLPTTPAESVPILREIVAALNTYETADDRTRFGLWQMIAEGTTKLPEEFLTLLTSHAELIVWWDAYLHDMQYFQTYQGYYTALERIKPNDLEGWRYFWVSFGGDTAERNFRPVKVKLDQEKKTLSPKEYAWLFNTFFVPLSDRFLAALNEKEQRRMSKFFTRKRSTLASIYFPAPDAAWKELKQIDESLSGLLEEVLDAFEVYASWVGKDPYGYSLKQYKAETNAALRCLTSDLALAEKEHAGNPYLPTLALHYKGCLKLIRTAIKQLEKENPSGVNEILALTSYMVWLVDHINDPA